jgi:serine protease AprX
MLKRLFVTALFVTSTLSFAASKFSSDIPKSGGNVDVIIRFANTPSPSDLKLLGPFGQIKKSLSIINGIHLSLPPALIPLLANIPGITYVTPNRSLKGTLDITTQAVAANLAWQFGYDGTGVGVAVIDSGIALKHDLAARTGSASRVVYSQSFVSGQDATDLYGHGTHVAGIIGSSGVDSSSLLFTRTFKGVAPNVNLVSLKVLDEDGNGQESDVIAAIQTAISLKNQYNIRVINLSLGRPVFETYALDPLCQAVEAAWKAGIVVVVAAGNYGRDNSRNTHGYGTISSPGNDPYVITVGATNAKGTPSPYDDQIASYSAKGPTAIDHIVKPDIVAPGNAVVSVLASTNCTLYTQSGNTHVSNSYDMVPGNGGASTSYMKLSGTSMATPVVAGAVALMLQKNPNLTPDQVKARLMKSSKKILPMFMTGIDALSAVSFRMQADIFTVGAGYLDVNAALASTDMISVAALSPMVVWDPVTHRVSLAQNFSSVFGSDDSVVWGDSLFAGKLPNGLSIVFSADDSVVWGDSTAVGFTVIWGDALNLLIPVQATGNDDWDQ